MATTEDKLNHAVPRKQSRYLWQHTSGSKVHSRQRCCFTRPTTLSASYQHACPLLCRLRLCLCVRRVPAGEALLMTGEPTAGGVLLTCRLPACCPSARPQQRASAAAAGRQACSWRCRWARAMPGCQLAGHAAEGGLLCRPVQLGRLDAASGYNSNAVPICKPAPSVPGRHLPPINPWDWLLLICLLSRPNGGRGATSASSMHARKRCHACLARSGHGVGRLRSQQAPEGRPGTQAAQASRRNGAGWGRLACEVMQCLPPGTHKPPATPVLRHAPTA